MGLKNLSLSLKDQRKSLRPTLAAKKRSLVVLVLNLMMNSLLLARYKSLLRSFKVELKRWKKSWRLSVKQEQRLNVKDLILHVSLRVLVKDLMKLEVLLLLRLSSTKRESLRYLS